MKKPKLFALGLVLCLAWAPAVFAREKLPDEHILVGRISLVEGQLLRYVYAEKDWVATVKDAPFGLDDALYSDEQGKAEFKLPNSTWVRIGSDTQIQLITLRDDVTQVDVAAGVTRFYNKSQNCVITASTPFGYAVAQPGTAFDLYVGDESAEIISLDGAVEFVLEGDQAKFTVLAGGASVISDGKLAIEGDGNVDADWDEWNLNREQLWTQRVQVRGESVQYLPPSLQDDAADLDEHGSWERVHYEGEYRTMWRPTRVGAEWQPFTAGRWTVYHEDNCWIPEEPYGYVTHHYGNWVYANSYWYWAPPVRVKIGLVSDCACWYPGRVAWIHSGSNIGWVPLAPSEIYYSHHRWGPAAHFVGVGVSLPGISVNIGSLAFASRAVIVDRSVFYGVNSYVGVRVQGIAPSLIVSSYVAAPIVSAAILPGYTSIRSRYVYNTNIAVVHAKPHHHVLGRIEHNRSVFRQARTVSARSIRQRSDRVRTGALIRGPQAAQAVQRPRLTGKIVPENQVQRPRNEVQFNERRIKAQARQPQAARARQGGVVSPRRPGMGGQQIQPGGRPETRGPRQPTLQGERSGRGDRPGVPGERRSGQPAVQGERGRPAQQLGISGGGRQRQPGVQGERGRPGDRPGRSGGQAVRSGARENARPEQRLQRQEQLHKQQGRQEQRRGARTPEHAQRLQQQRHPRTGQPRSQPQELRRRQEPGQQRGVRQQQQRQLQQQRIEQQRSQQRQRQMRQQELKQQRGVQQQQQRQQQRLQQQRQHQQQLRQQRGGQPQRGVQQQRQLQQRQLPRQNAPQARPGQGGKGHRQD